MSIGYTPYLLGKHQDRTIRRLRTINESDKNLTPLERKAVYVANVCGCEVVELSYPARGKIKYALWDKFENQYLNGDWDFKNLREYFFDDSFCTPLLKDIAKTITNDHLDSQYFDPKEVEDDSILVVKGGGK